MPVIPAIEKDKTAGSGVGGQPELRSETILKEKQENENTNLFNVRGVCKM